MNTVNLNIPDSLCPGEAIAVSEGPYSHWAIVSDRQSNGLPMLISLSKRTKSVVEETWKQVVGGKRWDSKGYLGEYSAEEVISKARSKIGDAGYSLFSNNCQHFVHWAHGVERTSPELRETLGMGVAGAAFGYFASEGNGKVALGTGLGVGLLSILFRNVNQSKWEMKQPISAS